MRVVWSAILFTLSALVGFYMFIRIPVVRNYKNCYNQAYSIFNEREKGIIIRRFNKGEEAICLENKKIIIDSLNCIQATDKVSRTGAKEQIILKKIAQDMLFGPKDMPIILSEHNQACTSAQSRIELDTRTNTWF